MRNHVTVKVAVNVPLQVWVIAGVPALITLASTRPVKSTATNPAPTPTTFEPLPFPGPSVGQLTVKPALAAATCAEPEMVQPLCDESPVPEPIALHVIEKLIVRGCAA